MSSPSERHLASGGLRGPLSTPFPHAPNCDLLTGRRSGGAAGIRGTLRRLIDRPAIRPAVLMFIGCGASLHPTALALPQDQEPAE